MITYHMCCVFTGDPFGDLGDFDSSIVTSLANGRNRNDDGTQELASLRMTKKQRQTRTKQSSFGDDNNGDDGDGDDDGFGDDAAGAEFYAKAAGAQSARKKAHADTHAMYEHNTFYSHSFIALLIILSIYLYRARFQC